LTDSIDVKRSQTFLLFKKFFSFIFISMQVVTMEKTVIAQLVSALIFFMISLSASATYDDCNQRKSIGHCRAAFPRWFYNKIEDKCEEFTYGGCGGNGNNFETEEECKSSCIDVCDLPKVIGPCRAAFPRWYYDSETKACTFFIYGACGGNGNNFPSEETCDWRCVNRDL